MEIRVQFSASKLNIIVIENCQGDCSTWELKLVAVKYYDNPPLNLKQLRPLSKSFYTPLCSIPAPGTPMPSVTCYNMLWQSSHTPPKCNFQIQPMTTICWPLQKTRAHLSKATHSHWRSPKRPNPLACCWRGHPDCCAPGSKACQQHVGKWLQAQCVACGREWWQTQLLGKGTSLSHSVRLAIIGYIAAVVKKSTMVLT